MSNFASIDLGGGSECVISIMNEQQLLIDTEIFPYNAKTGPGNHRRNISQHLFDLIRKYNVELVFVEEIKAQKGSGFYRLASTISLAKLTASVIDAVVRAQNCRIYHIAVVSWKAAVLGNRAATKEDAIKYVFLKYKKKVSEHEADSICLGIYGISHRNSLDKKRDITDK